jgi:lysophospholipase
MNIYYNQSSTHLVKDRHILILYTGGTIGMMKGEKGLTPKKNFLYEYMLNHPNLCDKNLTLELRKNNNQIDIKENFLVTPEGFSERRVFYSILEFEEVIDSANMNSDYWKMIGRTIYKYYKDFDAFIILHGTDTMNYSACILSFMLENLNKPVILTGSQIPLIEMRNDALKNLVDSLIVAGVYHIPEVSLMFDSKLFRGNRTIKNDNMGLKAFESPNCRPLVEIGINIKVNWDIILSSPTEEFSYFENIESGISVIKFFPIMNDSTFNSFFKPFVKAVIIETYGNGKLPRDRKEIYNIIKENIMRGVIIVNVSQCRKGSTADHSEDFLASLGVVSARDMTVECCLAKLSYLLGKGYDKETIKLKFAENIRGELCPPSKDSETIHSKRFVNALLNIIENEENFLIASTLPPTIINKLVEKGNLSLLKKLKNIIKIINFSRFNKKNPLHISAFYGNIEMSKFLLDCRIDINQIDEDKNTPLFYACMNNHRDLCLFLKSKGAILNQDKEMADYFFSLVIKNEIEVLRLFYLSGANLMVGNYDKRTPAHLAASLNKVEIMKFFVEEANINIMVEDRWGDTPYSEASREIKEIIKIKYKSSEDMNIKIKSKRKAKIKK